MEDEANAFVAWARAVAPSTQTSLSLADLCDGVVLFAILAQIDGQLFRNPHAGDSKDNWVLTIGTLKRLYKLMMQFYTQTLECSPLHLPVPDLNAIARSSDKHELCKLCLLAIGIAVQSDKNDLHISAIQTLEQKHQHQLMMSIERIITAIQQGQQELLSLDVADHSITSLEAERSMLQAEKETAQLAYTQLKDSHTALQTQVDNLQRENKDLLAEHSALKQQVEEERNEQADVLLRQEIAQLRQDLRRGEEVIAELESDNERRTNEHADLQRRFDHLSAQSHDASKLKDQMDEYKHIADKLHKAENVMEKHRKKLEEASDLRRQLKLVEEQNSQLVGRNASLEEDFQRVSAFKPLMDSYKTQMAELEAKTSELQRALASATYHQEQLTLRLKTSEDERARQKEEAELYQARIKELELEVGVGAGGVAGMDTSQELEEALSGVTMTDLKLQVRKLTRELEQVNQGQADNSRILVLENLLQDAQRIKTRYETDYLREHKQTLVLQHQLETIRSGKSSPGDGSETATALRLRLDELTRELDSCHRQRTQLEVQTDELGKQLAVAKADLTLVNKDQVDILHSLRASLDGETDELQATLAHVRADLTASLEQNRMYMAQVNTLLLEKVDLQADGIGQRDDALKRERALGELHTKLTGQSLPQQVQDLITALQNEALNATRELGVVQDKLAKAKTFIKQQDKMLKDKSSASSPVQRPSPTSSASGDVQQELRVAREQVRFLQREQRLMSSAYQDLGRRYMIELESGRTSSRSGPSGTTGTSWLANQRRLVNPTLQPASRR